MKVYKDKQFLIFDFENGKCVKYNFATHEAIGIRGNPVEKLSSQLKGITISDVINCCTDKQYAQFLKFVRNEYSNKACRSVSNIGTILYHVEEYANIEQFFSAGLSNIDIKMARVKIGDVPNGLIKICRKYGDQGFKLSREIVEFYKQNPDAYNIAFNLEYQSLTIKDVYDILREFTSAYSRERGGHILISSYLRLIDRYGYNAKSLLLYIDHLKTFEAIDGMGFILREIIDYCRMMSEISPRYEKYPRHFLTTHRIATRNYNRLKQEFDEKEFSKRIKPEMEYSYGNYVFIYPKSTEEIKDEAVQQNNCVASYIDRVIKGTCDILFMRDKNMIDKSLVTCEVRNGKIIQYRQHYNYQCNPSQTQAIMAWNKWYQKKNNLVA